MVLRFGPEGSSCSSRPVLRVPRGILKTYDGPLTLAHDLTVINVTADHIEVREVSPDPNGWPPRPSEEFNNAPRTGTPSGLLSACLVKGERR